MKLLVDIGNTCINWVLTEDIAMLAETQIQYADNIDALLSAWQGIAKPQAVVIAHVTKTEQTEILVKFVQRRWSGSAITIAKTRDHAYGVHIAYANAQQLGVDRWLALLAINHFYALPAMVVDCGTAMTIDVLATGGVHKGGLIVPGLMMMQQALLQGTHRLEAADVVAQTHLGVSTSSCIVNGILFSLVGMIEKVYQQVVSQEGLDYTLILTGGGGQLIYEHITINALLEPTIVLRGLGLLTDD